MSEQTDQVHSAGHDNGEENMQDIHGDVVLEGTVFVSGKEEQLKLMLNGLTLKASKGKSQAICLTWQHVICAVKDAKPSGDQQSVSFTLHYIHCHSNGKMRSKSVKITNKDGCGDNFIIAINDQCQKVPGRPKNVFVIVNPIGGAKRGRQIYQKTVAPLFELAGIRTTVKVTEKSKHALEIAEQQDFSGYDAIVVVGGDGLYQEVLQGLTMQTQKKAGVDYNNPDTTFVRPQINLGIIPAGTGNALAGWCTGVAPADEETAALSIIRGETGRSQILKVHSEGKFVTLCGVQFGYGEFADILKKTEEKRWMGRMRYPYCMIGVLLKKPRMFNCNIEYRLADSQEPVSEENSSASAAGASSAGTEWIVYTGRNDPLSGLYGIICERITYRNKVTISPFGNCVDLLVNFGSTLANMLIAMFKHLGGRDVSSGNIPSKLEYIFRITGFRIKLVSDETEDGGHVSAARARAKELEHLLNIDGEIVRVEKPEIDVRVQSEFVSLYGQVRVPDAAKPK